MPSLRGFSPKRPRVINPDDDVRPTSHMSEPRMKLNATDKWDDQREYNARLVKFRRLLKMWGGVGGLPQFEIRRTWLSAKEKAMAGHYYEVTVEPSPRTKTTYEVIANSTEDALHLTQSIVDATNTSLNLTVDPLVVRYISVAYKTRLPLSDENALDRFYEYFPNDYLREWMPDMKTSELASRIKSKHEDTWYLICYNTKTIWEKGLRPGYTP